MKGIHFLVNRFLPTFCFISTKKEISCKFWIVSDIELNEMSEGACFEDKCDADHIFYIIYMNTFHESNVFCHIFFIRFLSVYQNTEYKGEQTITGYSFYILFYYSFELCISVARGTMLSSFHPLVCRQTHLRHLNTELHMERQVDICPTLWLMYSLPCLFSSASMSWWVQTHLAVTISPGGRAKAAGKVNWQREIIGHWAQFVW